MAGLVFVIAGLTSLLALVSAYCSSQLLDSSRFSERVVAVIQSDDVRQSLAHELTTRLVDDSDSFLVRSSASLVENSISSAMDSPELATVLETSVRHLHQSAFSDRGGEVILSLTEFLDQTEAIVQKVAPEVRFENTQAAGKIQLASEADARLIRAVGRLRWAGVALPFAAVALFVAGALIAPDRRRALRWVGVDLFVVGLVLTAALWIAKGVLVSGVEEEFSDAVAAAWRGLLGSLTLWSITLLVLGLFLCGVSWIIRPRPNRERVTGIEPA